MKLDHIAVAATSEEESDRFFINLLDLEKTRSFAVSDELMNKFFGVNKEHNLIRYEKDGLSVEVILTEDNSKASDVFTHNCLLVENPEVFINMASSMGFKTVKVPRKDTGFYYFVRDAYSNLYEIKKGL